MPAKRPQDWTAEEKLQAVVKTADIPEAEARRVRELEREVARKDKALAETAALLVLKKKPRRSGGTRATTRAPRAAAHRDAGRRSRGYRSGRGQPSCWG